MLIFLLATITHFILQFVAWSFVPGNTAVDLTHSFIGKLWPVVSFPTFWISPKDLGNSHFWFISCANSIIWGFIVFLFIFLIKKFQ